MYKKNEIKASNTVQWYGKLTNTKKENIEKYYKDNYLSVKERIEEKQRG